jgi:hypothetical protein
MGLEFARANPRAAAQITYTSLPNLAKSLEPQAAYDSFLELAHAYGTSHAQGLGWGYNPPTGWTDYLKVVHDLGQTKKQLATSDVINNSIVAKANLKAAKKKAASDAKAFKLNSTWQQVDPRTPSIG